MSHLLLPLKRLLVLLLGLALVWFVAFNFFPWVDDRLPLIIALLVTYCFLAYVGLPAIGRIWHMLHRPTHVPTRSLEHDGWAADPINLVMLANSRRELIWAMRKAGWFIADPSTLKNVIKMVVAITFNKPYPTAPFEGNYVFGRKQDLGFQIPVDNSPRKRHHVRFWQLGTALTNGESEHEHHGFWRGLLREFLGKRKKVWLGAAVYDWGINAKKRNLQLVHGVDGNTVKERDFLVKTLRDAGVLKKVNQVKVGSPLRAKHHRFGELIVTDGYVKVCDIKRQLLPPTS